MPLHTRLATRLLLPFLESKVRGVSKRKICNSNSGTASNCVLRLADKRNHIFFGCNPGDFKRLVDDDRNTVEDLTTKLKKV